jgi:AP-3 complex subunit beta
MSLKDFYDDDEDAGGSPGDEERPKKLEKRARGKRAAPDRAAPDRGSGSGSSGSDEEKGSTRGGASDIDAEAARQVQARKERYEMDKDHKLLLRSALPLLKSRNAGVVLGVASLYYYLGSGSPTICSKVGRALTRELRNHREIAYVVLCNVAQMCERWPNMFRPELKEFYVRDGDPSFARLLKLKILCRIANRGVAPLILREMETYVRDPDKRFVEAAIRAVGEIAKRIPEVAGRCLSGLMALVRSPDPDVVAAAVVVVRRLLQTHRGNERAVRRLVGLLDSTSVPAARSSIVWIVGEFQDVLRTESADVLRKLAKGFRGEESEVKMQIVNLAVRLHLARRADDSRDASDDRVAQLAAYVLQLAKYDLDYDLRDRSRLLEGLVVAPPPADDAADPSVREEATSVLVRPAGGGDDEEAAAHEDAAAARAAEAAQPRFVLGSLSHCVDHAAFGYRRLPAWPAEAPDPSVREAPEEPQEQDADAAKRRRKERKRAQRESASFYASDEENDSDGSGSGSSSSSSSSSSDDGSGSDGSSSDGGSSDDSDESGSSGSSESDSNDGSEYDGSSASSSSSSDSGSDDDGASPPRGGRRGRKNKGGSRAEAAVGGLLDGLGDFGGGSPAGGSSPARGSSGPAPGGGGLLDMFDALDVSGSGSGNSQAPGAPLSPGGDLLSGLGGAAPGGGEDLLSGLGALGPAAGPTAGASLNAGDSVPADELRRLPLLRPALGNGLKVDAVFLREPSMYGERMNVVRLELENTKPQALERLRMIRVACPGGGSVRAFPEVPKILGGTKMRCKVHCDFAGKEEAVKFSLSCSRGIFPVELKPPLGELLTPLAMDGEAFASARKTMGGMQEASTSVSVAPSKMTGLLRRVLTAANIASVQGGDFVATGQARFAGRTIGSGTTVLFSVEVDAGTGEGRVSVNCANAMLSSTFLRTIKRAAMGE